LASAGRQIIMGLSSGEVPAVKLGDTLIEDTFAEAFGMRFVRLVVTAHDAHWLEAAIREFTGYSSSVIACDSELGVDQYLAADQTPDGRPGVAILGFGFSTEALAKAIPNRVGQCVMTCPSTAVFDGLADANERIPVMDGEFLVQDKVGVAKGVAGGNIILQASTPLVGLDAARRGVEAIARLPGVITPFPGGVARSGSKVGSRYPGLKASTSDPYCPTLRGRVPTKLHADANCAYEIVIDGVDEPSVGRAMAAAIHAAAGPGVVAIGAGNYGGKLGKFHFSLRGLL
jgi:formylmethanofuran--tetrahydromethanopterin N-formyltransferase